TRDRRASCINFDLGGSRVYPNPDGSLANQADRQHMAGKYPGIAAGAPAGTTLMAIERSLFRRVFGRIWGRVN
ncbi:MAG: hypothetical protein ACREIB_10870, partial [Pseudomonadota bacterium]